VKAWEGKPPKQNLVDLDVDIFRLAGSWGIDHFLLEFIFLFLICKNSWGCFIPGPGEGGAPQRGEHRRGGSGDLGPLLTKQIPQMGGGEGGVAEALVQAHVRTIHHSGWIAGHILPCSVLNSPCAARAISRGCRRQRRRRKPARSLPPPRNIDSDKYQRCHVLASLQAHMASLSNFAVSPVSRAAGVVAIAAAHGVGRQAHSLPACSIT